MSSSYVNDLRLEEIGTGDQSGTWGTTTNINLELIGEALGYGTQDCFTSDADATTTVADGATDPARSMYFKVTSSATLTATRTLTIAPNTISRVMFIENATTGSQSINISQGSGANVTIATGKTAVVYLDGAGSGAAVVDAMALVDPGVTDTLAEVLVAGNATGGTDIAVGTGDDITFADNSKAIFGAGSDLQIYHDASNSYISEAGTGNLIMGAGAALLVKNAALNENLLTAYQNGAVTLYYDNAEKLATTSTGIDITGNATFDDNGKAIFGAGSDLQIYHDGSASYIDDAGTGNLRIRANSSLSIQKYTGETMGVFTADGSVLLAYDNATKFETTSTGIDVTGTVTADGLTIGDFSGNNVAQISAGTTGVSSLYLGDGSSGAASYAGFVEYNHTGDYLRLGTGSAERMRIDSSGNVGLKNSSPSSYSGDGADLVIGTTSGDNGLSIISGTSGTGNIYFGDVEETGTGSRRGQIVYDHASDHMRFATAASEAMRIDSSGNVHIGTATGTVAHSNLTLGVMSSGNSTSAYNDFRGIHVNNENATAGSGSFGGGISFGRFGSTSDDTSAAIVPVQTTADEDQMGLAFFTHNTNTRANPLIEAMRIDSSGYVGIGTTAPSQPLEVGGASPAIKMNSTGTNAGVLIITENGTDRSFFGTSNHLISGGSSANTTIRANGVLQFTAGGGTEAMRIDSSGNLLVGKDATNYNNDGFQAFAGGFVHATGTQAVANSGTIVTLNRKSTDGSIVDFRKDGTEVGSIGTHTGYTRIGGNTNGGLIFRNGNISPWNNSGGAYANGTQDLGASGAAFKDLYLSGDIITGGNTLDINSGASNTVATFTSTDTEAQINLIDTTGSAQIRSRNDLRFYVDGGNTRAVDIDSSGNVGIGTSSPDTSLHISEGSTATATVRLEQTDATLVTDQAVGVIEFEQNDASGAGVPAKFGAFAENATAAVGLRFYTGTGATANERMRIDSSGNVGIRTDSPDAQLHVYQPSGQTGFYLTRTSTIAGGPAVGVETDSTKGRIYGYGDALTFWTAASGGTASEAMRISNIGEITSTPTYNNTTAAAANMYIASNAKFYRSTSSSRYKNTIQDASFGLSEAMSLRPVTYKGNNDGDVVYGGLIAEEVHDAGLTQFVQYDEEGRPDSLAYGNMVSLCIKAIQEQQDLIESLTARIAALEGAN